MNIRNLEQANAVLKTYIPAVKEVTGKDITLERIVPLMKLLGNPEAKLKIIHIAGTSGKTSTAYYVASLLKASGKKAGLTVSPHIMAITERVQIDLQPLTEAVFCAELNKFLKIIDQADPRPTYFELMVAFAYWYFAKAGTDYAVIETGLGGLHDATNIANRPDKICVITDIGFDHTKVLGNTIREITYQKSGIIYEGNQVFCFRQSSAVMKILIETCINRKATLNACTESNIKLPVSVPLFQQRNWSLANKVHEYVTKRDGLPVLSRAQLAETMAIKIPARMETVICKNKTIIMDGAHNPQKIRALIGSIRYAYPNQKVAVLAGFVRSRKPRLHGNLKELLAITNHLTVTSFVPNQEMYTNSADPQLIAEYCNQQGFKKVKIEPQPKLALEKLLDRPEAVLLITGSFYLMANIRPFIIDLDD